MALLQAAEPWSVPYLPTSLGLDYAANGTSTFDPADGRGLVLRHREFYDYFTTTRAFHVQPVPLPAAAWLFGWGLAVIGLIPKRR